MFKKYELFRAHCDVCGKQSELLESGKQKPRGGWRFKEYIQSSNYRFFALACSKKCQKKWEDDNCSRLHIVADGELPFPDDLNQFTWNNVGFEGRRYGSAEKT